MKNKQAFTILELLITVIIVGVLAGLALPRLFKLIKIAYAPEAIIGFDRYRKNLEVCLLMHDIDIENTPCDPDEFYRDCVYKEAIPSVSSDSSADRLLAELNNDPTGHFYFAPLTGSNSCGKFDVVLGATLREPYKGGDLGRGWLLFRYSNVEGATTRDCIDWEAYPGTCWGHTKPGPYIIGCGVFKNVRNAGN